jgi:hypothetical protein
MNLHHQNAKVRLIVHAAVDDYRAVKKAVSLRMWAHYHPEHEESCMREFEAMELSPMARERFVKEVCEKVFAR